MQPAAAIERVLRRTSPGRSPAVVFGASVNGLSFARSLGRRGIPVLLIDAARLIGTYTRHADTVLVPKGPNEGSELRALLEQLSSRCAERPVLFSTSDHYCVFVADNDEWLRERFRFLQPGSDAVRAIVDKRRQYAIAEGAGIPLPRTYFPDSVAALRAAASEVPYPAILKPYRPDDRPDAMREKAIKVFVASSAEELLRAADKVEALSLRVMIQEVVPGADDALYGYWGFWDAGGRERAWLTKRKRRQSPPIFGDGSFQETVHSAELHELTCRLLSAFDYRGFAGVEFKLDPRDGVFRLMEINPRSESGNQLAISAGLDLPWIGYRYLTGEMPDDEPAPSIRIGVKFINEEWDLKSFLALRAQGKLSVSQWLASLAGVRSFALGAVDDPLPLVLTAVRIGRAVLRRFSAAQPHVR